MLRGNWNGQTLGSGSDTWKYWDELRAGNITQNDWQEIEGGIARSWGTCMTMGTASTMTIAVEAMGFSLPGASAIPAPDSNHARMASACGRRIVDMVWEDLTPKAMLSEGSIDNAVRVAMALGGSTNSIVHLIAMARRAGVPLDLDRFDALSRSTPLIANIRPAGKYLMEDFLLRRRLPRADAGAGRSAGRQRHDGYRQAAGRRARGRPGDQCRRDPAAGTSRWLPRAAWPC